MARKKIKRPSPKLLGNGMARQAAEAAIKRNKRLQQMLDYDTVKPKRKR